MSLSFALSLPAMFLLVLSWKLMRHEPTRDRIKNACGLLFGMSAFFLAFFVLWQVGVWLGRSPYPVDPILALFISIVIILPTNAGVARYVMRTSGIVPVKGEFVGKGSYMLLAFLLWAILSPICMDLFDKYQTDSLLDFGFVFGSFIIPYVFYRLAVKYWVRDTIAEQVALDYPSKDETLNDGVGNP